MSDPHYTSSVECDLCAQKWIAVYPVGTEELECPRCGMMRDIEDIEIEKNKE